jgi:L-ascorbate metabolism protein UlaG (beta-lactamase superfamily)
MRKLFMGILSLLLLSLVLAPPAQAQPESDVFPTSSGDLAITFLGHASLMLSYGGKVIYVDPWSKQADYSALPKADLVLVTHEHQDHLDPGAVAAVRTDQTLVVCNQAGLEKLPGAQVMANGQTLTLLGLAIQAVPAYNLVHMRQPGVPYHPKGVGNGYVIAFGDKKVYVAGDTENTPEMKALKNIDVAFLPMSLPFTMTSEMVADAAKAFRPRVLYPYHYGQTDPTALLELMKDAPDIQVRIRQLR